MKLTSILTAALLCTGISKAVAQMAPCPLASPNLIVNGNFEQGYYGFTSDFGRGINNATKAGCATQGWILVTQTSPHVSPACQIYPQEWSMQYGGPNTATNSNPLHPSNTSVVTLATCNTPIPDHTTGSGFFLTIDPDAISGRAYWKQKIRVCPNTDYVFSVWVRNVEAGCGQPAPFFHFEVAGLPINIPTSYPDCNWVQTAAYWNSGNAQGDVWIELINDQPGCVANDVAIDDVFFGICGSVLLTAAKQFGFCGATSDTPISLSGVATGFHPPVYQWQRFAPGVAIWKDIPGATDTVYHLPNPGLQDAGLYRLFASAGGHFDDPFCALTSEIIRIESYPVFNHSIATGICQGETYAGYTQAGIYVDSFQTSRGCDSIRTLYLEVQEPQQVAAQISICPGSIYDFNGKSISAAGTYTDTLFSRYGCDSIVVLKVEILADSSLGSNADFCYVPNIFSPNDDGYNDLFMPAFAKHNFKSYLFQIFDRWGNLLFSTENSAAGWDGRFRGKDCPAGVYVYTIVLETDFCKQVKQEGSITIIR